MVWEIGGAIATLRRGCTGSLGPIIAGAVVGAGVAVTAGINLCLVGVGAIVAGAAVGCGAGAAVGLGASVVGAIVATGVGAAVGWGATVGAGAGAAVGAAVAAGVSSSSSPQATITIAISATNESTASVCPLLIHIVVFTLLDLLGLHKVTLQASRYVPPLDSSESGAS